MNREEVVGNIRSRHVILDKEGNEIELEIGDPGRVRQSLDRMGDEGLKSFVMSEEVKGQPKEEPPSIKAMRQLELFDYEPSADSGHFRHYPKGQLMFELLKDWADRIALDRLECMQIESPMIYDWNDPEIREQADSFHERNYSVSVKGREKEWVLRFAGDFGLFKIMKQAGFSKRMLPLRMYEFSKSFRYEKSGELSGFRRLRAFHMPDIHCFCADIQSGWEEYQMLYKAYSDLSDSLGVRYAIAFRVVEDFYQEHKDRIVELLRYSGRPAMVEILSDMKHYWAVKNEFQCIDSVGGNLQVATVQLDVKDAEVYGISYLEGNEKKGCIICHSSIGAIERWIYAILEKALLADKPVLPLWLSPVQLRLIPVSEKHIPLCESFAFYGVRHDIDDRKASVGAKIARARKDWVPYYALVGDKEVQGSLKLMERDGSQSLLSVEGIQRRIKEECSGMPFRPLHMPKKMSLQPRFI